MAGPQMQWESERQRTEGQGRVKGERWRHFEIEECMQQQHAMPNLSLLLITPPPLPLPKFTSGLVPVFPSSSSFISFLVAPSKGPPVFGPPSSRSFPASFPPRCGLQQTDSLLGEGEGFPRWRMPWAALLVERGCWFYWQVDTDAWIVRVVPSDWFMTKLLQCLQ